MKHLQEEIIKIQRDIEAGQTAFSTLQKQSITETIRGLDNGTIRVASKDAEGQWVIHEWVKHAILQYFRIAPMTQMEAGPFQYHDKIPLKTNYKELNVRVVPPATARMGSFMEAGVVLMPSYTNIGSWIGAGSMIDTWATVGSCAQIGAGVHISGGVGIGGVLEPASASPVIIEDGAFIGSRCILVEGVHIGQEAVLAANVSLTASTPIIDIRGSQFTESRGKIPPGTVVIPGTREKNVTGGKIHTSCVYIIGERKESTDRKTSLNQTLREFSLSV